MYRYNILGYDKSIIVFSISFLFLQTLGKDTPSAHGLHPLNMQEAPGHGYKVQMQN